jgi:cytochrome c553
VGKSVNLLATSALKSKGRRSQRGLLLAALFVVVGLVSAACYTGTGSYPVEVFSEMHYSQSFKAAEPPRLHPPLGSVPRNFRDGSDNGAELFAVNCSMCHGVTGKGNGTVLKALTIKYKYVPVMDPDLSSDAASSLSDEGIASLIRQGVNVMPSFSKLLTEEEIRLITQYVRTLQ